MLSNVDLERLIAAKKREILKEKSVLGLSPPLQPRASLDSDKENTPPVSPSSVDTQRQLTSVDTQRQVTFADREYVDHPEAADEATKTRREHTLPPDLERYIRRYIGLPVMLKAGEYSPNNPLLKGETPRDRDAFIGLGDYERRSKTLRRLRQQEYRQYLDQQAKKKQEEREQAEREARERERRECEREERLRERESEQKRLERERQTYHVERLERNSKRFQDGDFGAERQAGCRRGGGTVDAGVQVGRVSRPLSVAVQTDPADFYALKHRPANQQAERELSPRTGVEPASHGDRPAHYPEPAPRRRASSYDDRPIHPPRGLQVKHTGAETDPQDKHHRAGDENDLGGDKHRTGGETDPRGKGGENDPRGSDDRPVQRKGGETDPHGSDDRLIHRNGDENDPRGSDDRPFHRKGGESDPRESDARPVQRKGGETDPRGSDKRLTDRSSCDDRPIHPAHWINESRRRSYGDYDERTCALSTNGNRNKQPQLPPQLAARPRQGYMPSIFDEDAIAKRNNKAEQEAAERRLFYQKELKSQIEEQQRIREERKAREKMLEMAEMRRLEEQLKMLRLAQDKESAKTEQIACAMRLNAKQYESKRTALQREIEAEQKTFLRAVTQPAHMLRSIHTSRSEHNFPTTCKLSDLDKINRKPFSTNIAENSIFSPSYDLDNYLRLNLNPSKESLMSNKMESYSSSNTKENRTDETGSRRYSFGPEYEGEGKAKEVVVEKALVHDEPKLDRLVEKSDENTSKTNFKSETLNKLQGMSSYEPSFLKKDVNKLIQESPMDVIPVLRHSPKVLSDNDKISKAQNGSDAMKRLEGKWAVPAVQKNILKTLPSGDGKNVSILTQLGSIRRQLQMEQLKLDKMLSKDSDL